VTCLDDETLCKSSTLNKKIEIFPASNFVLNWWKLKFLNKLLWIEFWKHFTTHPHPSLSKCFPMSFMFQLKINVFRYNKKQIFLKAWKWGPSCTYLYMQMIETSTNFKLKFDILFLKWFRAIRNHYKFSENYLVKYFSGQVASSHSYT